MNALDWKPIENAPYDELVMARNSEFGPYEFSQSKFLIVFMDPPPEEFVTMKEWNEYVDAIK